MTLELNQISLWVMRTSVCLVILLEADSTPGNGLASAGESFHVDALVRHGPIKALSRRSFPPKLAIICHPSTCVKAHKFANSGAFCGNLVQSESAMILYCLTIKCP